MDGHPCERDPMTDADGDASRRNLPVADSAMPCLETPPSSGVGGRPAHRRHPARWIATILALVSALVIYALAVAPPSTQVEVQSPLLGHPAPAVTGQNIVRGVFDLRSLRGHFVVIDFFASWCVPCQTEQPQLVKFAQEQKLGALLVGVIFEDTVPAARTLLGPWIGLYPVVSDPGGRIALNFGVRNPPSKYVVDPSGRVVAKLIGPVTAAELDAIIVRAKGLGA
jgi:cytochrome c biogenesis protein CcmG, thiol:disulfide interchange protein DsbE